MIIVKQILFSRPTGLLIYYQYARYLVKHYQDHGYLAMQYFDHIIDNLAQNHDDSSYIYTMYWKAKIYRYQFYYTQCYSILILKFPKFMFMLTLYLALINDINFNFVNNLNRIFNLDIYAHNIYQQIKGFLISKSFKKSSEKYQEICNYEKYYDAQIQAIKYFEDKEDNKLSIFSYDYLGQWAQNIKIQEKINICNQLDPCNGKTPLGCILENLQVKYQKLNEVFLILTKYPFMHAIWFVYWLNCYRLFKLNVQNEWTLYLGEKNFEDNEFNPLFIFKSYNFRQCLINLLDGSYTSISNRNFFQVAKKDYDLHTHEQICVMLEYKSLLRYNAIEAVKVLMNYVKKNFDPNAIISKMNEICPYIFYFHICKAYLKIIMKCTNFDDVKYDKDHLNEKIKDITVIKNQMEYTKAFDFTKYSDQRIVQSLQQIGLDFIVVERYLRRFIDRNQTQDRISKYRQGKALYLIAECFKLRGEIDPQILILYSVAYDHFAELGDFSYLKSPKRFIEISNYRSVMNIKDD